MVDEMVIWSVRVVMIVKRFEQSSTEKALYKCSHYYYYYIQRKYTLMNNYIMTCINQSILILEQEKVAEAPIAL